MTTKPAGITTPSYAYLQFGSAGMQTTDVAYTYTSNNAYQHGPNGIIPVNPTAAANTSPSNVGLTAQNAVASMSAVGGLVNLTAGVGSNANASGNVVAKDTAGNGAAWNTTHYVMGAYHLWVDTTGRLRIKGSVPTSATDGNVTGLDLSASAAWTPGSVAAASQVTTVIAVAGAVLGDIALASFSLSLAGGIISAYVSSTNNVTVSIFNPTGSAIPLTVAGTVQVKIIHQ